MKLCTSFNESGTGLRHVQGVRPNRAADFRGGGAILDPKNSVKINFHFATHCNVDQRSRNAATRCVLRAYKNAAKCDCGERRNRKIREE